MEMDEYCLKEKDDWKPSHLLNYATYLYMNLQMTAMTTETRHVLTTVTF